MKKIYVLSCILFLFISVGYSCDPIIYSFCDASHEFAEEKVVVGKILSQSIHGTELEVIEMLKGQTTSNTIMVWDGTDINCNGLFSMSVDAYGIVGDTVICIVQQIDELQNSWETIGDYRRPSTINYITYLEVDDESLWDYNQVITYTDFLNNWSMCLNLTSNNPLQKSSPISIYPNPTSDHLVIKDEDVAWTYYSIISVNGHLIQSASLPTYSNLIKVNHLDAGIYILKIFDKEGVESVVRFIKI